MQCLYVLKLNSFESPSNPQKNALMTNGFDFMTFYAIGSIYKHIFKTMELQSQLPRT